MAVALAQPTDVVKVRFQAQARPSGESRRYCSTIDAYKTIAKEEGIHGLWKGRLVLIICLKPVDSTCVLTATLSCRNCSKHRQKCDCELHRTGDLRFNQGHSAQVHSPDRCHNNPDSNTRFPFPSGTLTGDFCPTDNLPCHLVSAFGAGLCTTVIASPVDVVKTRYMNSSPGQYSGVLKCAASMLAKEGPFSFYKG